jgi:hypothetical protein
MVWRFPTTVRAELVEAPFFFAPVQEGQGFDKLGPNGLGDAYHD